MISISTNYYKNVKWYSNFFSLFLFLYIFFKKKRKKMGSFVATKNHTAEAKRKSKMYCNEANKATLKSIREKYLCYTSCFSFFAGLLTFFFSFCLLNLFLTILVVKLFKFFIYFNFKTLKTIIAYFLPPFVTWKLMK